MSYDDVQPSPDAGQSELPVRTSGCTQQRTFRAAAAHLRAEIGDLRLDCDGLVSIAVVFVGNNIVSITFDLNE